MWIQSATSVAVWDTTQLSARAKDLLAARTAARRERVGKAARALEKTKEESTVASFLAKVLGKTGKARTLDKLEKDVRRWMEVVAGTVEARALQQIARSRVNNKRVV